MLQLKTVYVFTLKMEITDTIGNSESLLEGAFSWIKRETAKQNDKLSLM